MADHIIVNTPVTFKRWSVPNFANPASEGDSIAVRNLSRTALHALAQAWIDDLYAHAGEERAPHLSTPEGEG